MGPLLKREEDGPALVDELYELLPLPMVGEDTGDASLANLHQQEYDHSKINAQTFREQTC